MHVKEYVLPSTTGRVNIRMPMYTEILTARDQGGKPILRARVDPGTTAITRVFLVVETGKDVAGEPEYVGTVQLDGGKVLDVFEVLT